MNSQQQQTRDPGHSRQTENNGCAVDDDEGPQSTTLIRIDGPKDDQPRKYEDLDGSVYHPMVKQSAGPQVEIGVSACGNLRLISMKTKKELSDQIDGAERRCDED